MLVLVVLLVLLGTTCLLPAGVEANRKVSSVNALLLAAATINSDVNNVPLTVVLIMFLSSPSGSGGTNHPTLPSNDDSKMDTRSHDHHWTTCPIPSIH